jgi:hypothetical protein
MLGRFRLPEPPAELRERVLGPSRRTWVGWASAATLLLGALWATLGAPGRPARPAQEETFDELRVKVVPSADGRFYTMRFRLKLRNPDATTEPAISVEPGKWGSLFIGETSEGYVLEDPPPGMELRKIIESGVVVQGVCEAGPDGKIAGQIRAYRIDRRKALWTRTHVLRVDPMEEVTWRLRP